MAGGATLGLVALGCVRKQTEQAMETKSAGSVPPRAQLEFLPPVSSPDLPHLPQGWIGTWEF